MYRLPEDGRFSPKHVAVNKVLYCCATETCICWFNKWEI